MDIITLAAWGEFLGGIGVVVSLIYLASQIRQNTKAVRGTAHESSVSRNTTLTVAIGSNPQLADLLVRANQDYGALTGPERVQLNYMMGAAMVGAEATYLQYRRGNLEEEVWQRSLAAIRSNMTGPGIRESWKRARAIYTDEFRRIVDEAESIGDVGSGKPAA